MEGCILYVHRDDLPYAMLSVKVLTSLKNVLEKHAKQQLQEKNDMKETEEANGISRLLLYCCVCVLAEQNISSRCFSEVR